METSAIKDFLRSKHLKAIDIEVQHSKKIYLKAQYPIDFILPLLKEKFPETEFEVAGFVQHMPTQLPGYQLKNVKNTIAVVSGKGGVGKSTVACNLAIATQMLGSQVGLLDADIYGPSLPTMMGIHQRPEITENARYVPPVSHHIECMSMGLLQSDGPLIWRGPMLAKALIQMIDQTSWSELDYLFLDLPPGTGDIPLSLIQKIPLSGAIIVTTPQTVATLDAEKAIEMFLKTHVPILGIINNMAWHSCEKCHHHNFIFGDQGAQALAKKYQLPLLGEIPLVSKICQSGDEGLPLAIDLNHPIGQIWRETALHATQVLSANRPKIPPIRSI